MLPILRSQTQPVPEQSLYFFDPIVKTKTSLQSTIFRPRWPIFGVSLSLCQRTQTQKSIVCARKNKRRNGSQRLSRLLLQLMPVIASNLKIFPQPLDLIIEEFFGGDGNGGGLGIWKGFGGGGSDGFRSKPKRKWLILFLLYGILAICGLGFLLGRDLESNVLFGGLGFGLSGITMVQWWEKIAIFGIFTAFFGGVLVGMGFKREHLQKLGLRLRACYPTMETVTWRGGRRRGGRRAF